MIEQKASYWSSRMSLGNGPQTPEEWEELCDLLLILGAKQAQLDEPKEDA